MLEAPQLPVLDVADSLQVLAISMGLGGLVGLQREHAESRIAGIRTFPLITLLGTISGLIFSYDRVAGSLMILISMVGVIAASSLGNYLRARLWVPPSAERREKTGSGITTEMAILVMYAVGVYLAFGYPTGHTVLAVAVTGAVVLLLYAKQLLHRFVSNLGEKDVHAIMQFILLACVILPILPNKGYGPYEVLNPRNIWMVVVLVVGISLFGYVAYRLVGERAGTVLSGLMGGMISSTATTASFARRARESDSLVKPAMLAILLASSVVFVRLFVELSAVASQHLSLMAPPLATIGAITAALAFLLFIRSGRDDVAMPQQQNPTNLKSAFFFGAVYTLVSLAAMWAQSELGPRGLFAVAAVSGLTDMDAITLSSGRAVTKGLMSPDDAWRAIAVALMSSMVMKVGICGTLGNRHLLLRAAAVFAINIAATLAIILLWPRSADAGRPDTPAPSAMKIVDDVVGPRTGSPMQ